MDISIQLQISNTKRQPTWKYAFLSLFFIIILIHRCEKADNLTNQLDFSSMKYFQKRVPHRTT